jgi:hypothetical protein
MTALSSASVIVLQTLQRTPAEIRAAKLIKLMGGTLAFVQLPEGEDAARIHEMIPQGAAVIVHAAVLAAAMTPERGSITDWLGSLMSVTEQRNRMEPFCPPHALVCERCFLVQLEEFVAPADICGEYAYFSSYADSWVAHAQRYFELMERRFALGTRSRVVEIASNAGMKDPARIRRRGCPIRRRDTRDTGCAAVESIERCRARVHP